MRYLNIFLLAVLISPAWIPSIARAAEPSDVYADAVYATTVNTYAPENALGAADGAYADFREAFTYVTLDMGEGEEGTGNLMFTSRALEYGAAWQVEFYDANLALLQSSNAGFGLYETQTTVAYTGAEPYRYLKVIQVNNQMWGLDAVEAASVVVVEEEPADEQTTGGDTGQIAEEPEEDAPPQGLLVKLVDDGDAETTVDAAVYVIGADGLRHAFPSEMVFKTWFEDFEDVAFIDPTNLAAYPLGANVTVRPGTWLVKVTTDTKVYAVEPGGILRWITTEEIALSLWGSNWNNQIVDVPDTFWGNYTVGDPITVEKHPAGTIAVLTTGEVTYLDASAYYTLPGSVFSFMRFTTDFSVQLSDEKLAVYDALGALTEDPDIAYPY